VRTIAGVSIKFQSALKEFSRLAQLSTCLYNY